MQHPRFIFSLLLPALAFTGLPAAGAGAQEPADNQSITPNHAGPRYLDQVVEDMKLTDRQVAELTRQGFIILGSDQKSFIADGYYMRNEIPVYVTADSVLQVFYSLTDDIIVHLEKRVIGPELGAMLGRLADRAAAESAPVLTQVFLESGARLINPERNKTAPANAEVAAELQKIMAASETDLSSGADYTQYRVRGHYTGDAELGRIMRALMLVGRQMWRTNEADELRTAAWMAYLLEKDEAALKYYKKLASWTQRLAGPPDSITPLELADALNVSLGKGWHPNDLKDSQALAKLQAELAKDKYRTEEIHSELVADPGQWAEKSVKFLPQAWSPDSWVMQQVAMPFVPERTMPTGMDVLAGVFGSARARVHLAEEIKSCPNLAGQLDKAYKRLQSETGDSLHQRWLASLEPLTKAPPKGAPAFMYSEAWADTRLNTALASWAQLRHTLLPYVEQAYVAIGSSSDDPGGAVEPLPLLYARLRALVTDMGGWLAAEGQLTGTHKTAIEELAKMLSAFEETANLQLAGKPITEEQRYLLLEYGGWLTGFFERDLKQRRAELVVDVATASLSGSAAHGQVLHAATGSLQPILVIWPFPDGLAVARGYVMSYYEFREPDFKRLTDEEWLVRLAEGAARPAWAASFTGDSDATCINEEAWERAFSNALENKDTDKIATLSKQIKLLSPKLKEDAEADLMRFEIGQLLDQGDVKTAVTQKIRLLDMLEATRTQPKKLSDEMRALQRKSMLEDCFDMMTLEAFGSGPGYWLRSRQPTLKLETAAALLEESEAEFAANPVKDERLFQLKKAEVLEVVAPEAALKAYRELAAETKKDAVREAALAGIMRLCAPEIVLAETNDNPDKDFWPGNINQIARAAALIEGRQAAQALLQDYPASELTPRAHWTVGMLDMLLEADCEAALPHLQAGDGFVMQEAPGRRYLEEALRKRFPEEIKKLRLPSDNGQPKRSRAIMLGVALARLGRNSEAVPYLEKSKHPLYQALAEALKKPAEPDGTALAQFVAAIPVTLEARAASPREQAEKFMGILHKFPTSQIAFQLASANEHYLRYQDNTAEWLLFLQHNEGRDPVEDASAHYRIIDAPMNEIRNEKTIIDHLKSFLKIYLSFGREIPERLKFRMKLYGEKIDRTEAEGVKVVNPLQSIIQSLSWENNFREVYAFIDGLARDYGKRHPIVGLAKLQIAVCIAIQDEDWRASRGLENEAEKLFASVAKEFANEPVCAEIIADWCTIPEQGITGPPILTGPEAGIGQDDVPAPGRP